MSGSEDEVEKVWLDERREEQWNGRVGERSEGRKWRNEIREEGQNSEGREGGKRRKEARWKRVG